MATKKKKKKQNIKTLKSYAVVITQHIMSGFNKKSYDMLKSKKKHNLKRQIKIKNRLTCDTDFGIID